MRRTSAMLGLVLLLACIGAPVSLPAQNDATIDLRRAIETETVKGDLKRAIEQYRKLADGKNRTVAAQALLRLGRLYELLGSAEARTVYERIVAGFPDQKDAVEKARSQLGAARTEPAGPAQRLVWDVRRVGPAKEGLDSPEASEGSVSVDGRYICFTVDRSDASYLAVRDLASGTDRVLTNAPKADSSEGCSFSPAGNQIAYTWHARSGSPELWEVRVVALTDNATPRTLLQDSKKWFATPAWSSDGGSIAVQAVHGNERDGDSEAILVSVRDRSTRVLSTPGSWRMFFSPDGRYIALDHPPAGSTGQRDVFVLPVDGSREVNVTENPGDDRVMGWSPDSSRVLFASDRRGETGLYAVSVAQGKRQGQATLLKSDLGDAAPMGVTDSGALHYHLRSGGASYFLQHIACDSNSARCVGTPVTLGPASLMAFTWSPDGRYIAYTSSSTRNGMTLKIRAANGNSIREVSPTALPLGGGVNISWAPNGRAIAVATLMGGRLALVDVEGDRAQVTWSGRVEGGPISSLAWSADQRKLLYLKAALGPNPDSVLVERDLASHGERELLRRAGRPGIRGWSLSPDGLSVWAFVPAGTGTSDLLAIPVGGGEPRVIARALTVAGGVHVSPDGRYVATASGVAGTNDAAVLLIPTDGSRPRELIRITEPSRVANIMWARDSTNLYFRRRANNAAARGELWHVKIDSSEARIVEDMPDLEMGALSPDGRRLAFIRGEGGRQPVKSEVWKLEHFLPAAVATQR